MTPNRPSWFFKPINIPELDAIQQEFIKLFDQHYSHIFDEHKANFVHIDVELIKQNCPTFISLLTRLNLLDRWYSIIWAGTNKAGAEACIHVDEIKWWERCMALNIPIQNYHDSYTVWYDADIEAGIPGYSTSARYPGSLGWPEEITRGEAARLPVSQPAFVNNGLPHRPITNHNEPRLIISARFSPELFDYDFDRLDFAIDR